MEKSNVEPLCTVVDQSPMMVHVTAPSTLPAGYKFDTNINDDSNDVFSIEVPEGGVVEGQTFLVPLLREHDDPRIDVPTGRWKDGVFDCCSVGCLHPSLWCSWCCSIIALGQVMTRMRLTWLGGHGPVQRTKHTFTIVVAIYAAVFLYSMYLNNLQMKMAQDYAATHPDGSDTNEDPFFQFKLPAYYYYVMHVIMIWFLIATCRTRKAIRQRYDIPEKYCVGCEDCCCAYWCGCCTVSQMLRHTGDYEHYIGDCCSKTGHPPGTPLVV